MGMQWNGDVVRQAIERSAKEAARKGAEHIKERAVQRTPLETGALRNSAKVTTSGKTAAVSYNTPYAVKQHEEVGYQHGDGEAKFLENTVRAEQGAVQNIIAEEVRKAL